MLNPHACTAQVAQACFLYVYTTISMLPTQPSGTNSNFCWTSFCRKAAFLQKSGEKFLCPFLKAHKWRSRWPLVTEEFWERKCVCACECMSVSVCVQKKARAKGVLEKSVEIIKLKQPDWNFFLLLKHRKFSLTLKQGWQSCGSYCKHAATLLKL